MTRRKPWRWAYRIALLLLLCDLTVRVASAQEAETPRFVPATRGPRASLDTANVQRWREMVAATGEWDVDLTLTVIACESEGVETARNASGATGLLQLMRQTWTRLALRLTDSGDLTHPFVNLAAAYYLWQDSGGRFSWHWFSSMGCWR